MTKTRQNGREKKINHLKLNRKQLLHCKWFPPPKKDLGSSHFGPSVLYIVAKNITDLIRPKCDA